MLHYECRGNGPAIVFVAGLGGLGAFWKPVMDRLQDSYTVITFDHPGTGRSLTRGPQTIEDLTAVVLELTASEGIDRFTVVGHSTGGLVAQALAIDHASVLEKLVLSCTWAEPDRRFRDLFRLRRRVLTEAGLAAYKTHGSLLAYTPEDYERYAPPTLPSDVHDEAEVKITAARIDMLLDHTRSTDLKMIATPTLVMGAIDDQIVPFLHSQQLARMIDSAQLERLVGGHFPPLTQPDAYASRLRTFLETN